ncbi:hypothetical protein V8J82_20410 [Gymnodinialimonas sp. 2305UL16-5]|uniref:hypothetical protein n=1 Tax=Gymnodinialimonas mytili TaxID=3126503 RepID=UPI00309E1382
MRMPAIFIAACLGLAVVTTASPGSANSQIERYVARELPGVVPDVDLSTLSPHQIRSLYMLLSSEESTGTRRREARSIIYGLGRVFQGLPRQFP